MAATEIHRLDRARRKAGLRLVDVAEGADIRVESACRILKGSLQARPSTVTRLRLAMIAAIPRRRAEILRKLNELDKIANELTT